jgi:hypothetical protein
MGMPGQSKAEKSLFSMAKPNPIYSAINQQDFTEYPVFYYKARNFLTSKAKEFLIKVLR